MQRRSFSPGLKPNGRVSCKPSQSFIIQVAALVTPVGKSRIAKGLAIICVAVFCFVSLLG